MVWSELGGVEGAVIGTIVLTGAWGYLLRSPNAPRISRVFFYAFSCQILRFLAIALAATGIVGPMASWIADMINMGSGVILAGAFLGHAGSALRRWHLLAIVGIPLAWGAGLGGGWWMAPSPPATMIFGGMLTLSGAALGWRYRRGRLFGAPIMALLMGAWGVIEAVGGLLSFREVILGGGVIPILGIALALQVLLAADRLRGRQLDVERRDANAMLRLQGEAMAAAANAIFITDRAGRIAWANAAFSRMTGWPLDEVLRRGARHLLLGREKSLARFHELVSGGRPWHGELDLRRKDGSVYMVDQTITPIADERGCIRHYVVVQEDITHRRQAEERIRFLSNHDALTTLPNRLLFREQVQKAVTQAKSDRSGLAVLFLDLDEFTHYNDILGHDGGDRLLLLMAERLMAAARGIDLVARVGGDEFGFLLTTGGVSEAAELARILIDAVTRPFVIDGHDVHVGCSVGLALYPEDGTDAEGLMKSADMAMYRAIRQKPNGYCFFSMALDAEISARREMEADLRHAIVRNELVLHYQPVVSISRRRIIAVEALVRWHHPRLGLIPPVQFISMAEEIGLIGALGEWVLREACRQGRDWLDAGLPEITIAVNLSAVQLRRQDLALMVRRILAETKFPADSLELELTESAVMDDPDSALTVLNDLRALGVRLAVDDFGTGYSSLARLKSFPVGKLKIDRSFVADLAEDESDAAIARAVVSLAHALELRVVAEGVENDAQLAILAAQGCDCIQGYLFSRPLAALDMTRLLHTDHHEIGSGKLVAVGAE